MIIKPEIKIALLCFLALVVFGCGSDSSSGAAAPQTVKTDSTANKPQASANTPHALGAVDVCSLVSNEEVGAAIGAAVVRAETKEDICIYETEDAAASRVEIEVKRKDAAEEMQAAREAAKILGKIGGEMKQVNGAEGDLGETLAKDSASVSGVGDEAFFGANEQLFVLKKGVYFTVLPPTMRPRTGSGNPLLKAEEKRRMAKVIAQKAAAKL